MSRQIGIPKNVQEALDRESIERPDGSALLSAEEYLKQDKPGGIVAGFTVYVPAMTGELPDRLQRAPDSWNDVHLEDVKYQWVKLARGGLGHVWIGHSMVEPDEFFKALQEVEGFESDTRVAGNVGFEWWVEGGVPGEKKRGYLSGSTRFKLIPTAQGWCVLETRTSYGTRRDIYKIDDMLKGFAMLGVLEKDGPQTLAPYRVEPPIRPREVPERVGPDLYDKAPAKKDWEKNLIRFTPSQLRRFMASLGVAGFGLGMAVMQFVFH